MTSLEERVTVLEDRLDDVLGRLAAIQSAVFAVAGETDLELRQTLMEDLVQQSSDLWIGRPLTERQLKNATRGLTRVSEQLTHAFERPLLQPMFRQPLPRRKGS